MPQIFSQPERFEAKKIKERVIMPRKMVSIGKCNKLGRGFTMHCHGDCMNDKLTVTQ